MESETLTFWELGPYHCALSSPIKLKLALDGERIVRCEVETGFLHKGLEKVMELQSWRSTIAYADHLDPEASVFGELILCLAMEDIAKVVVPPRAKIIRLLLVELSRISSHLLFLVRMAQSIGSETVVHYILRDREKILDLFELLTGARFSLNFLKLGGVSTDVTDGFLERVLEICTTIHMRMKEYNELFIFNHGFLKRTSCLGILSSEWVRKYGITGPNARASGFSLDMRKSNTDSGYELVQFEVPMGTGEGGKKGDAYDRVWIRLKEIIQSIKILKQLIDILPSGGFINHEFEKITKIPLGETYVRMESSRGLLGCFMVSNGSNHPVRIQFRTPSVGHLMCIPSLAIGLRMEDLPVLIASLDISISEADR